MEIHYELKSIFLIQVFPEDGGTFEKLLFLINRLYISDIYHIVLYRRDVKAYKNHLNFDFCQN